MAKTLKKIVDGVVYEMAVDEITDFEQSRKEVPEKKEPSVLSRELVTDEAARAIGDAVKADENLRALAVVLLGSDRLAEAMKESDDA